MAQFCSRTVCVTKLLAFRLLQFAPLMVDAKSVCDFADIKDSNYVQGIVLSSMLPAMQRLACVNVLDHCCGTVWHIPTGACM